MLKPFILKNEKLIENFRISVFKISSIGDNAIGQVQRFATYSEENEVPRDKIRLGFVCAKIKP